MHMARFRSQILPGPNPHGRTETGYEVIHSSSQTFESYVAKSSEQKVEFRGIVDDQIIHSPRKEVHGLVEDPKPIISHWGSPRKRDDRLTPYVHHGGDNSSPKGKHYVTTHNDGDKLNPWNSTPNHVEGFSPKARHEVVYSPSKGSPRNNQYNSPIGKDHDAYYFKEGMMNHSPPVGRKDTHYEKSSSYNDDENTLKGTAFTQPKKDMHYETRPYNMVVMNPPPIKTRIDKGSSSRDKEFSNGSGKNSPVSFARNYDSPTRKEYHYHEDNVVDMYESHRRYAKVSQQGGAGSYVGTIDSDEAARKYRGLVLSG